MRKNHTYVGFHLYGANPTTDLMCKKIVTLLQFLHMKMAIGDKPFRTETSLCLTQSSDIGPPFQSDPLNLSLSLGPKLPLRPGFQSNLICRRHLALLLNFHLCLSFA